MKNRILFVLITTSLLFACSFDNQNQNMMEIKNSYSVVFNEIEFSLDGTGGEVNFTIIGERPHFQHPTHVFASIDFATTLYKKEDVYPISITKTWMEENSVIADRNVSGEVFSKKKLLKYSKAFGKMNLEKLREFFIDNRNKKYDFNYQFKTLKEVGYSGYSEKFPENLSFYIINSIISSSPNFDVIKWNLDSTDILIQPVIDMYIHYKIFKIDCKKHHNYFENCDEDKLKDYNDYLKYFQKILKLAGKDQNYVERIELKNISPELDFDLNSINSFEDVKQGKHLKD